MPSGSRQIQFGDKCRDCSAELNQFNASFRGFRLNPRCKECQKIHTKTIPSRSPDSRSGNYISWKYNLTLNEYEEKLKLQLGGCAICKRPCKTGRKLAVDHDHKTNIVRDLLCHRCNLLLGHLEDDENLIWAILEYLKRHTVRKVS